LQASWDVLTTTGVLAGDKPFKNAVAQGKEALVAYLDKLKSDTGASQERYGYRWLMTTLKGIGVNIDGDNASIAGQIANTVGGSDNLITKINGAKDSGQTTVDEGVSERVALGGAADYATKDMERSTVADYGGNYVEGLGTRRTLSDALKSKEGLTKDEREEVWDRYLKDNVDASTITDAEKESMIDAFIKSKDFASTSSVDSSNKYASVGADWASLNTTGDGWSFTTTASESKASETAVAPQDVDVRLSFTGDAIGMFVYEIIKKINTDNTNNGTGDVS